MSNDAFKDIEKLETDLWEAADNLWANSKLISSDSETEEIAGRVCDYVWQQSAGGQNILVA